MMRPYIRSRFVNSKTYAMHRMAIALGRAVNSESIAAKDRASCWAGAWGLVAGISCGSVWPKCNNVLKQRESRKRGH
jgi:hypothetical protein